MKGLLKLWNIIRIFRFHQTARKLAPFSKTSAIKKGQPLIPQVMLPQNFMNIIPITEHS